MVVKVGAVAQSLVNFRKVLGSSLVGLAGVVAGLFRRRPYISAREEHCCRRLCKLFHIDPVHMQRLRYTHKLERKILIELSNKYDLTKGQKKEILGGAYVRLYDDGQYYKFFKKNYRINGNMHERVSSHDSKGKQYGLMGNAVGEMLVGKDFDTEKQRTYTWFQLERTPCTWNPWHFVKHIGDYVLYKLSGHNQGPWGSSPLIEKGKHIVIEEYEMQDMRKPVEQIA